MTDKNYMAAEDMEGLARALANLRSYADGKRFSLFCHSREDAHAVLAEYDRMRRKLDQITEGKTMMVLTDEDRAKPIQSLSDEALLAWTRPTLAFLHGIQDGRAQEDGRGVDALFMLAGVISAARMCTNANAGRMAYKVSGATDKDGELGDWQIIVEKVEGPDFEEMVETLTNDEGDAINILSENPMGVGPDNFAVDANGAWTGWEDRRFLGKTRYDALKAAHDAFITAEAIGDEE